MKNTILSIINYTMTSLLKRYKALLKNDINFDIHTVKNDPEFDDYDQDGQDEIIKKLFNAKKRYHKLQDEQDNKSQTNDKTLERLRLEEKYDALRNIKLPEQRSPEWFAMRNNKITASDAGMVVGENKYEPQYQFVFNKVFGKDFTSNEACYHGKKFEQVVTMYYEYKNDVIVDEFGLLGHPKHDFLGASPDGIVSKYKRDNKTPTELLGRMLEIKCPLRRKINYEGNIKGDICPIYYWCQVQIQLECCDLDDCDFIQCVIEEYNSRKEFLEDTHENCDYKSKLFDLPRGVVIQLVPDDVTEITESVIYDKTTFLYPPKIDMTTIELDTWILDNLDSLPKGKKLHRIIYWRFNEIACHLIKRDKEWFSNNLETFRMMWSFVEMFRNNPKIALECKNFVDKLAEDFRTNKKTTVETIIKNYKFYNRDKKYTDEDINKYVHQEIMKKLDNNAIIKKLNEVCFGKF